MHELEEVALAELPVEAHKGVVPVSLLSVHDVRMSRIIFREVMPVCLLQLRLVPLPLPVLVDVVQIFGNVRIDVCPDLDTNIVRWHLLRLIFHLAQRDV